MEPISVSNNRWKMKVKFTYNIIENWNYMVFNTMHMTKENNISQIKSIPRKINITFSLICVPYLYSHKEIIHNVYITWNRSKIVWEAKWTNRRSRRREKRGKGKMETWREYAQRTLHTYLTTSNRNKIKQEKIITFKWKCSDISLCLWNLLVT